MRASIDLETRAVTTVALLGSDYRGIRFELLCREGDRIMAGAALMRDARRPEIRFAAPAGGSIAVIERGARRKLVSLQIEVDASAGVASFAAPAIADRSSLRKFMLETGAWSSLRTRPFGNIPHPEAEPAAIFVTALDNQPLAPEPRPIIDANFDEFEAALGCLATISTASLYVCHAPDHALGRALKGRVQCVPFEGDHRAGLPGVHINALCPIGFGGGEVWHLGYQDVIALGYLLLTGRPWLQRVISLGGSAVRNPRSLLVSPGAAIDQLLADEVADGPLQIRAGSSIYGRPLAPEQNFLGAGQRQITAVAWSDSEPGRGRVAGVVIPGDRLEQMAPPGIFAVPLMRALQIGDAERARALGALELAEEDLAPLSRVCVSGNDYGLLLRKVLDQLEQQS